MKIFVAGGTSGIGLALARKYAQQGHELAICGRNLQKLEIERNSGITAYQLDIYNKEELAQAVKDFAGDNLDRMIISAGSYADDSLHKLTYHQSVEMLKINLAGTINVLEVAREAMCNKQKGSIVVIASVSGLLHYKKASIYSKTKRAVIQIADAYRKALSHFGISITIIAPGYIDTPRLRELNNNDLSRKPFLVSCDKAVQLIIQGVDEGKELVVFPKRMKFLMQSLALFPSFLLNIIMYRKAKWMNRK